MGIELTLRLLRAANSSRRQTDPLVIGITSSPSCDLTQRDTHIHRQDNSRAVSARLKHSGSPVLSGFVPSDRKSMREWRTRLLGYCQGEASLAPSVDQLLRQLRRLGENAQRCIRICPSTHAGTVCEKGSAHGSHNRLACILGGIDVGTCATLGDPSPGSRPTSVGRDALLLRCGVRGAPRPFVHLGPGA